MAVDLQFPTEVLPFWKQTFTTCICRLQKSSLGDAKVKNKVGNRYKNFREEFTT
jgi:hypothetical protein